MNYPNDIIKKGSTNKAAVMAIKARLVALGIRPLDVANPNFGDTTEEKVKEFQKYYRLLPDGEVGLLTWTRLFAGGVTGIDISKTSLIADEAYAAAITQLKVRELTGKNDGEAVESYLRSVGLGKGYSWCAAFVYWCFNQAAKKINEANPLYKTAGVLDHWNNSKGLKLKPTQAQTGDIFIMDFGGGKGHTGIITEVRDGKAFTIEGNTNVEGSREGDGVYERCRNLSSFIGVIRY